MPTKFSTNSRRVKGLSFHPKQPWILASLHTGVIQLWDYRIGTLIHSFLKHEGPVRGVHFHYSQPLFVSGGHDYEIKLWNYETRVCLFTLYGHFGRIRTVQFHHEYPWIVSASDDQTIRIWNWQAQTCVSVLTGHNHNVMCASFHPKEDLVVSASLDQTVRVWDIGALLKTSVSPADAKIKYVLEGHERGVNWAAFHPSLPIIVSGGDDHQVKLWHMNRTKAWEVDTLRGHTDRVSSVMFHVKKDKIVSTSKDKTFRVWNATTRTKFETFRRDNNRFWIAAVHPEKNLVAAGHDSGMNVLELERQRPAFVMIDDSLLYVKDRSLWLYNYSAKSYGPLMNAPSFNQSPRTISYNYYGTEQSMLMCSESDLDGGSYELHVLPKDGSNNHDVKRGTGGYAVFIGPAEFAVLDKSTGELVVKNTKNDVVKKIPLPIPTVAIFYAGSLNLLCASEGKVIIFDLVQRLVLGELESRFVIRYVVWSSDMESVALLSKHIIILANKNLVLQCKLFERKRVKSGAWDENGVFIYTTSIHIKYCLPHGDSGIIRTMDTPIYITKVSGNIIFGLNRHVQNWKVTIDSTEYIFKVAVLRKRYDHVMSTFKSSQLYGQAMIAYLHQKGLPEVALHFVEDEKIRFNLALESGNFGVAVASATKVNEKDCWYRLGAEALRHGNFGTVEFAYEQTKNFDNLSFIYLITGNLDKLSKLMKIPEVKNNVMSQFHNALYLGDVKERVKRLEDVGQFPLAYITASVHGLKDIAEQLSIELGDNLPSLPQGKTPSLLMPPTPVMGGGDWPLLTVIGADASSLLRSLAQIR